MRAHIFRSQGLEIRLAEQLREPREVRLQRFGQACAIAAAVDPQSSRYRHTSGSNDMGLNRRVTTQHVLLEIVLDPRKGDHHAARARVWFATDRACSNSRHSSASGGMFASRSIMVETLPNRRIASA